MLLDWLQETTRSRSTLAASGSCPGDDALFTITVNESPDIDPITDIIACDTYTIPAITGVSLTGNQTYYDASLGTGNIVTAGTAFTTPGTTTIVCLR